MDHSILHSVEQDFGLKVTESVRVYGGDINSSAVLTFEDEQRFFIKWNKQAPESMFETEFSGLQLLSKANHNLHIPKPVKWKAQWLVMELLSEGSNASGNAVHFGQELGRLHKNTNEVFGLDHNNFIGRLKQSNNQHAKWADFYINERILPLARLLFEKGHIDNTHLKQFESLHSVIEDLYPEEPASLIHGDLWSGNYFYLNDGNTAIFDPAVYFGHREMDLAMTRLFGGFAPEFYHAYEEVFPTEAGFEERLKLSQLYPVLVHACLFGGHYIQGSLNILNKYV